MRLTSLTGLAVSLALVAFSASAWAGEGAPPKDTLKVNYFSNANTAGAPDGTVQIDNPGTSGGNLCAYINVFDVHQEMSECCACLVTPDGLRTLSVNTDLTSNPETGKILSDGIIKIVSTQTVGGGCPLPNAAGTFPTLAAGVRAWGTHIQNTNFTLTETTYQDATLSNSELYNLGAECYAVQLVGSGAGICSCGTGD